MVFVHILIIIILFNTIFKILWVFLKYIINCRDIFELFFKKLKGIIEFYSEKFKIIFEINY